VREGDLIDAIIFHFDDGTNGHYGGTGGSLSSTTFKLEEGEYLTKIK